MLLPLLAWLILFVGLLCWYACLLYENEQGRLQNRIDRLWVAMDDRSSASRTSAFFGSIARVVTRGFNRFFGKKLMSFQFVGVSVCSSLATLALTCFAVLVAVQQGVFGQTRLDPKMLPFLERFVLIFGLILSLLAILPSIFPSRWAVALSMIPAGFLGLGFLHMTTAHLWTPKRWAFLGGLLLGLLSDILLLVLVRFTVRWVSEKATVSRIVITLLMPAGIVYFLVLVPFAIPTALPIAEFRQSTTLMTLTDMGGLNIFTGIASSVFLLMLIFVLLHRITWPILSRLFYQLARYEVVRNPKIMFRAGTVCVVLALPLMHPGVVKSCAEFLVKHLKEL